MNIPNQTTPKEYIKVYIRKFAKWGAYMNIGFDMSFTKSNANYTGIGRYTHKMIDAITRLNTEHTFHYFDTPPNMTIYRMSLKLDSFFNGNPLNLFHLTSPFESICNTYQLPEKKAQYRFKMVATLYDIIPFLYKEIYLNHPLAMLSYTKSLNTIQLCDHILVISETTKHDAMKYLGIHPSKMTVISGGVDETFKVLDSYNPQELQKYGITKPYLLCIAGNGDYRKNLPRLIEAFGRVNSQFKSEYQLVIIGELITNIEELLNSAHTNQIDLVLTGKISDQDLVYIYNSAKTFVFPSLYEGFGLPVLEAMACGVPVITSNTTSLKEISGDAAYLIHPESIDEIAIAIEHMLSNPQLHETYREKGLIHVKNFTWDEVGRKVLNAYRSI